MSILSNIVEFFAPARRAPSPEVRAKVPSAKSMLRSYKGAEISRLTGDWITSHSSIDDEVKKDSKLLRLRARDLARNSPIARSYLSLLSSNVIGPMGFVHEAKVRNNPKASGEDGDLSTRINGNIERAWKEWSEAASLDGRLSFVQLQHQLLEAVARDGEVLVRKWRSEDGFGLALEAIDADMLDEKLNVPAGKTSNEIRMGVEVDSRGRRVAYHIWNRALSILAPATDRKRERIPADDIIHLYDPDRVNQTRGVTWFAPVMLTLHMLDGYVEAALTGARVAAAKMGWFVRQENESGAVPPESADGTLTTDATPGSFDFAPDGYTVEAWDPNQPNTAFSEFVRSLLRQVAVGLRVSYNALVSDLESVNYSSMRSGLLIERETWRKLQGWWLHDFIRPVYREFLMQGVLTGAVRAENQRDIKKLVAADFTPRGWSAVDPLKDTNADIAAIGAGLTTRTDILAEQGRSFEDVLAKRQEEKRLAEQYGVEIDETPKPAPDEEAKGKDSEDDDTEKKPPSKNGAPPKRFTVTQ
jgi:lambda family phage portal protein